METIKQLLTNETKAATATVDGREYLIAPDAVLAVEGVMNGVMVFAETLEASVNSWNHRPVPVNHPMIGNEFVTAGSPQIIEQFNVGYLYNARMDGKRLVADVWVDIGKAEKLGGEASQILTNIKEGIPFDVSTAYTGASIDKKGSFDGVPYYRVMQTIYPDHLALLPNQKGACPLPKCGVFVNVLSEARTPVYDGTENTSWEDVPKTFSHFRDAYYLATGETPPTDEVSTVVDAPSEMREWIAGHTLLGDVDAENERDLLFFPVVNPETGKLNRGALMAVLGGRASQAGIPETAKQSAQKKARELLDLLFSEDDTMENETHTVAEQAEGVELEANQEALEPCGCKGTPAPTVNMEDMDMAMLFEFVDAVREMGGLDKIKGAMQKLAEYENKEVEEMREALATNASVDPALIDVSNVEKLREAYNALPKYEVDYTVNGAGTMTVNHGDDSVTIGGIVGGFE